MNTTKIIRILAKTIFSLALFISFAPCTFNVGMEEAKAPSSLIKKIN